MISSKEEALELCAKYGVKLSNHKTVIVTGNNSIYLDTDNVDPKDSKVRFVLKGVVSRDSILEETIEVNAEDPTDAEIEAQILKEEKNKKNSKK